MGWEGGEKHLREEERGRGGGRNRLGRSRAETGTAPRHLAPTPCLVALLSSLAQYRQTVQLQVRGTRGRYAQEPGCPARGQDAALVPGEEGPTTWQYRQLWPVGASTKELPSKGQRLPRCAHLGQQPPPHPTAFMPHSTVDQTDAGATSPEAWPKNSVSGRIRSL